MVIDHCICIKSMFSLQFLFCPQSWKSCPQFRKSEEGRQKWPILAAKKVGTSANFFLFSLNPYCHVLFAKNGVQIGQILLLWPHFYFTSAYRGSPPCTLSHYPDNRETGYSNVLILHMLCHQQWTSISPYKELLLFVNSSVPGMAAEVEWGQMRLDASSAKTLKRQQLEIYFWLLVSFYLAFVVTRRLCLYRVLLKLPVS